MLHKMVLRSLYYTNGLLLELGGKLVAGSCSIIFALYYERILYQSTKRKKIVDICSEAAAAVRGGVGGGGGDGGEIQFLCLHHTCTHVCYAIC